MKLSVSIPDELWAKAQILEPELAPSALVQYALRTLTEGREATPEQLVAFWNAVR